MRSPLALTRYRIGGLVHSLANRTLSSKQDPPAPQVLWPRVASFDVFETLLVRRVGDPDALFLLLAQQIADVGLLAVSATEFKAQRIAAYARARTRSSPGDPALEQIYDELRDALGCQESWAAEVMRREVELEAASLVVWPPGLALLREARQGTEFVVFTSDTYLSQEFVERQLRTQVGVLSSDLVLTSASLGESKRDGGLFEHVLAAVQGSGSDVLHVGNHQVSDVTKPRERGIGALHLTSGNLNRYEQLLEQYSSESGGLSSVLAGASRLTRGGLYAEVGLDPIARARVELVAGVLGPVVVGYVLWSLELAKRRGLKRLYFLAREGKTLLSVAQHFAEAYPELDLRYLFVSRQSVNLASFSPQHASDWEWLLTDVRMDTLPNALARLGMHVTDPPVARWLAESEHSSSAENVLVDSAARFTSAVRRNEHGLMDLVEVRRETRRAAAMNYLDSAGFLDNVAVGMVDVAGVGSQLRSLAALRRSTTVAESRGILFNRYRPPAQGEALLEDPAIDAYYSDGARGVGFVAHPHIAALLELSCAVNDGTVLGYGSDPNGSPVVELGPVHRGPAAAMQENIGEMIALFASNVAGQELPVSVRSGDVRVALTETMGRLWREPTREEALALAPLRIESGSGVVERLPLVEPQRLVDVAKSRRRRDVARPWFYWHEGSMMSSSPLVRSLWLARRLWRR